MAATGSTQGQADFCRPQSLSRSGHHAGHGDLSPRARGTTADRGRLGRDLSPEPARRRIGRVSRWDDADSRVADSDVSAHPSRDVARGRRRPLSDLETGSGVYLAGPEHGAQRGQCGGGLMKTGRTSRISDFGQFVRIGCALGQKLPLIRHEECRKAGTASRSNDSLGFERCLGEVQ